MYDINIVIVNWKMKDDVEKCLRTLYADLADGGLSVVTQIIDNSENADGIKEMLAVKFPQVIYTGSGGNIGFGKAQNLGFKKIAARFYLALNPDIEFIGESNTFKRLMEFMEKNPQAGIIAPKLLNSDGTIQDSCYRFPPLTAQLARRAGLDKKFNFFKKRVDYYLMRDFNHSKTAAVDWVMGSFMLVRKELADKIGFFDDRYFMYFEDCDWCRRTWRAGFKVFYVHDIIIKHGHRRESAGRSVWQSIFKNQVSRIHLKSWAKYFWKWGIKKEHCGE